MTPIHFAGLAPVSTSPPSLASFITEGWDSPPPVGGGAPLGNLSAGPQFSESIKSTDLLANQHPSKLESLKLERPSPPLTTTS